MKRTATRWMCARTDRERSAALDSALRAAESLVALSTRHALQAAAGCALGREHASVGVDRAPRAVLFDGHRESVATDGGPDGGVDRIRAGELGAVDRDDEIALGETGGCERAAGRADRGTK